MHRLPMHLVQELHAGTIAGLNLALNMWFSIGTPLLPNIIRNSKKILELPSIVLKIPMYSHLHLVRAVSSTNENWHELVKDQPIYGKKSDNNEIPIPVTLLL